MPAVDVRPGNDFPVSPFIALSICLQDQLRALRELVAAAFGSGGEQGLPAVEVYDGDTPMGERCVPCPRSAASG